MTSLIEEIQVRKHELDQELAEAQAQQAREDYHSLMIERAELEAQRDQELTDLAARRDAAVDEARAAQIKAAKLSEEARLLGHSFLNVSAQWAQRLDQQNRKIMDTRPPEIGVFISWVDGYFGVLGGYVSATGPFKGLHRSDVMPMRLVNDAGELRHVVDREAHTATVALLRSARQQALDLGVGCAPEHFLEALETLRAETEAELERLRTGTPQQQPKGKKSS